MPPVGCVTEKDGSLGYCHFLRVQDRCCLSKNSYIKILNAAMHVAGHVLLILTLTLLTLTLILFPLNPAIDESLHYAHGLQ